MRGDPGTRRGAPTRRRGRGRTGLAAAVALGAFLVAPLGAQVPGVGGRGASSFHPDASYTAETLLRNAANHARDGQWAEAIDLYERVIREHGESVALVPRNDPAADAEGGSQLYVDARRHCQTRLASLPPEARAIYRRRVDPQAERLYREGAGRRDRAALRRVVDEMFCSAWGDEAADLLGDLAFQQGRYGEALSAYGLLVPDRDPDGAVLVHPDPSVDLARVAAKKLLCRAAMGDAAASGAGLEAFRARYPEARGHVAGRDGSLSEVVASALAEDGLAAPSAIDGRWPTFAGGPSRSRVAPEAVEVGDFQWRLRLDDPNEGRGVPDAARLRGGFGRAAAGAADRELAYHPIILGDQVVVCGDSEITAFRLDRRPDPSSDESGRRKELLIWRSRVPGGGNAPHAARGQGATPRYTLTAHGDRIYARLESAGSPQGSGGVIVALENSREVEGKLKWVVAAGEIELPRRRGGAVGEPITPAFEGSPVADGRHVYVALTAAATETWVYVACLDAATGEPAWVKYLGNASSGFDMMRNQQLGAEPGDRLLSLEGQTLVYQTNMGAVAALDADTGAVRWLATYPTRPAAGMAFASTPRRELNPAVLAEGLVIVAPQDAPEILAFDASTGQRAWKTKPVAEVVHLLGVAGGKLFATGDHVFTFDARTGGLLRTWPEVGRYEGYGRGLLAGDRVYWPNRTEIHVLDQATGGNVHETIPLSQAFTRSGGNLAVGGGFLVVAERDQLVVYCQSSRLIDRYEQLIVEHPEEASHHFQLARLAEASGRDELALASLERAARHAGPSDRVDGRPLAEVALRRRHLLLMKLGEASAGRGDWAAAIGRFEAASESARTDRERLTSRLALAGSLAGSGTPEKAVEGLQELLTREWIGNLTIAADDRRTVRADLLVADRIAALIDAHGRGVYARYDAAARELLERGRERRDAKLLREVGRSYPVSEVAPEALLALGGLCEALGQPGEAASAYKRLLAVAPNEALRARALWGLAEVYESQGYLAPARDLFAQAQARFPDVDLTPLGVEGTVGALAGSRLARPEYAALRDGRAEPSLPVPLIRHWDRRLGAEARPLSAEGLPPSPRAGRIFLASGTVLRPVDPTGGEAPWEADLGGEPTWVGYLAGRVLAATPTRLVALDAADGRAAWEFDPADPTGRRRTLNPFAKPELNGGEPTAPVRPPGRLHGFRLVGPRLILLRGDHELLALDSETGQLDWSYAPASGGINPRVLVTPTRVVLEAGKARSVVVLDPETGRLRGEFPRGEGAEPWAREPLPIDDDRVVLALDPKTVALFDLERGVEVWTYRDGSALPRAVPPRLLADSGCLLVLFGGDTLVRLDPSVGEARWERALGLGDLSECPEAFALDGERVYVAHGTRVNGATPTLSAFDLSDGNRLWWHPLVGPGGGWSIALSDRHVVAHPDPSRTDDGPLDGLPIVFCRRDTGAPVQRLIFPATVRRLAVRLDAQSALVATQGRLWSLGALAGSGPGRTP